LACSALASPTVDGDLIPDWPRRLLRDGKFHRIPYITGTAADGGTMFIVGNITSDDVFRGYVGHFFPDRKVIARIEQMYPDDPSLGS
jgi:acetylcholinesterase